MNALDTPVNTQAHGKWFQWKPLQIKDIQNEDLAMFFIQNRADDGLVSIPDHVANEDKNSIVYLEAIEECRKQGIANRINKLNFIIANLEQSLRYDLEAKNIKADPLTLASKGELAAYKELANLKEYEHKAAINVAEEIRRMKGIIDGGGSSSDTGKNNQGFSYPIKSTKA